MADKRLSSRAQRQAQKRAREELVHDAEELARREPGGAPERAILVSSPALVDVMATSGACPLCEGGLQLEEHAAETINGESFRIARLRCTTCGVRRVRYFRLGERPLH